MAEAVQPALQELHDREAIKELMARYCYTVDSRDWAAVASLFAEDAVADFGPLGRATGRDDVHEWFETVPAEGLPFFRHMVHNPIIEVDGDEASGTWYADVPSITDDDEAIWIQGIYENEFVREDDEWRFSLMDYEFSYAAPYDKGWAEQPFVDDVPGSLEW